MGLEPTLRCPCGESNFAEALHYEAKYKFHSLAIIADTTIAALRVDIIFRATIWIWRHCIKATI